MNWEKDFIRFFGYEPIECIGPSSIAVYKIKKGDEIAIAKIAFKEKNAKDLSDEQRRLKENQDLNWMPKLILHRDYMGNSIQEAEILELFKKEGWKRRNPAILIKEYIPGTILNKTEHKSLNLNQFYCIKSQMEDMHLRRDAGLDICSPNILVQTPQRATLFDLGPSFGIHLYEDRKKDDIASLDLLVK
jgi:hypothetical protein